MIKLTWTNFFQARQGLLATFSRLVFASDEITLQHVAADDAADQEFLSFGRCMDGHGGIR